MICAILKVFSSLDGKVLSVVLIGNNSVIKTSQVVLEIRKSIVAVIMRIKIDCTTPIRRIMSYSLAYRALISTYDMKIQ